MVQLLQRLDSMGTALCNEVDCPLLQLTNVFHCVSSNCIQKSVSIHHECSNSCIFKHGTGSKTIERENVSFKNNLTFHHDYTNNIYCLNVYCMH